MGIITINSKAKLPQAIDDVSYSFLRGTTNTLDVLNNDLIYSLPAIISSVTPPNNNGTVTIINNGTELEYTSDSGFIGFESFQYTLTDAANNTSTAIVTIQVHN